MDEQLEYKTAEFSTISNKDTCAIFFVPLCAHVQTWQKPVHLTLNNWESK